MISHNYFSLDQVNSHIENVSLGFMEVKSRPSPIGKTNGVIHLKQSGKCNLLPVRCIMPVYVTRLTLNQIYCVCINCMRTCVLTLLNK